MKNLNKIWINCWKLKIEGLNSWLDRLDVLCWILNFVEFCADPDCCDNKRIHFNILANNSLNLFISELYVSVSSLIWILCRKTLALLTTSYLVLRTFSCLSSHHPWIIFFLTVCSVPSKYEYKQYKQ